MSFQRLVENIRKTQNPIVAGLDPKLEYIPAFIREQAYAQLGRTLEGAALAIWEFNRGLIDALCDVVPAVKPQAAYYEMFGWQGMQTLERTIRYAQEKGMFVITDGKRNDIGTTMEAYALAHLGEIQVDGCPAVPFGADALTVNGYLGSDGIKPLLSLCDEKDKGIFVLVKTSNPSSGELQDRLLALLDAPAAQTEETVYEAVGRMCESWGSQTRQAEGYSAVGAVVGATYPRQLEQLRRCLPTTFFLVPGYGAQGGGGQDVAPAFDKSGSGAIVNSSRGILCAWKKEADASGEHYAEAARREALRMKEDITRWL